MILYHFTKHENLDGISERGAGIVHPMHIVECQRVEYVVKDEVQPPHNQIETRIIGRL